MHNTERDDVEKELVISDDATAQKLFQAIDKLNLRIEQRRPGKPIVCELLDSEPLELIVIVPGDQDSYTLQALRPLAEGDTVALRRRGGTEVVHGTLYHCRKAQREGDHPHLHLAGLKITQGIF